MRISTAFARAGAVAAMLAFLASPAFAQKDEWYKDSQAVYDKLLKDAGGGTKMTWDKLPDWSGLWLRQNGVKFDPDAEQYVSTTAKLTPEYAARFERKLERARNGLEWDYLSYCLNPGFPRWITEPLLKEFVLRPDQIWLINENYSDVRRVYLNAKHIPEDEAFPRINGDSIGFWDKDTLVIHTTQVRGGDFNRGQPDFSEQASTLEKWRLVDKETIVADITVWDPLALREPWHGVTTYKRDHTPGLRLGIWSCEENTNVIRDPKTGGTTFILPGEPGYRHPKELFSGEPPPMPK